MFFYANFLRPPPRASGVSGSISITPQISNDLRTSYDGATDLYYAWVPSLHDCAASSVASSTRKLTTWRESSMYKSIAIPLPSNAKVGQEWRLALAASDPDSNFVINLAAKSLGGRPLPVISMPVRLEEQGKKIRSPAKQEQIERLYAIPASAQDENTTILLCIREQTSFDLDKKIWDSGLGLSSWLTNALLSEPEANILTRNLKAALAAHETNNGLRILELGAGTGIVSICISALLEKLQNAQNSHVLATDLPSAIELIEHNIAANKHAFPTLSLEASALDWNEDTLPQPVRGPIDLLVMADVTYNIASFPALVRTLDTLIKSSQTSVGGRTPMVIVAYKQRDPAERELWPMLSDIGVHLNLVDSVKGAGAEAVEIWLWIEGLDMKT